MVPSTVLKKLREEEQRRRAAGRIANGMTLTPWLNQQYLQQQATDRDALLLFAGVVGIALVVCAAWYLAPVVAGMELGALFAAGGGAVEAGTVTEVTTMAAGESAAGLGATVETAGQWLAALGRPIQMAAPAAVFLP